MAYRFNGTSDYVEFANAPFNGNSFGVGTFACFVKRTGTGSFDALVTITDSSFNERLMLYFSSSNAPTIYRGNAANPGFALSSTSLWYLIAITFPSGAAVARFHVHDGTSWTHTNTGVAIGANITVAGTDKLVVGRASAGLEFFGDMVCAGIKKANATDLQIETLSRTSFQAWRDFGFDWLIGFDSSQETAGILQDQATPGTGDEVAISGTSQVSDAPGWSWAAASTFVPQTIMIR